MKLAGGFNPEQTILEVRRRTVVSIAVKKII
jgi:hypothetical protein